jgi:hypothetical protein
VIPREGVESPWGFSEHSTGIVIPREGVESFDHSNRKLIVYTWKGMRK